MNYYRADLHIHTVCSPCGDIDMSPLNIINTSLDKGLHIIGITDHNCTKQAKIIKPIAEKNGLFVLAGAEITTQEEVHVLVFMPDENSLDALQDLIEKNRNIILNNPKVFGYQLVVDENENVLEEIPELLTASLRVSIDSLVSFVIEKGGIIIPAHIDKSINSIISQLGFIPTDLPFHAFEVQNKANIPALLESNPILKEKSIICSSDSHFVEKLGNPSCIFKMKSLSFAEILKTFQQLDERCIMI